MAQGAASPALTITIVPTSATQDAALIGTLTDLVNAVYGAAESDIFRDGYQRTSPGEISTFINNGELAIARLNDVVVGCMFVRRDPHSTDGVCRGGFGMLALDPKQQGLGLGRSMVLFAEEYCLKYLGCEVMRLELLFPTKQLHKGKERLQAWYLRMGYEIIRVGSFADEYPHLESLLAGPTEYRIFEKSLVTPGA
jgi:GNAT superfamily N-acetyltransferase